MKTFKLFKRTDLTSNPTHDHLDIHVDGEFVGYLHISPSVGKEGSHVEIDFWARVEGIVDSRIEEFKLFT